MDYCKEFDEYVTLYIDELLDDATKSAFLNHIAHCSKCSVRFSDAMYCAELCRGEQDIQLPENFAESLHTRLQEVKEVSENGNKNNSIDNNIAHEQGKLVYLLKSKRLIASLSTAAVLVISLLAINLLPNINMSDHSKSLADYSDNTRIENKEDGNISETHSNSISSGVDKSVHNEESEKPSSSDNLNSKAKASTGVIAVEGNDKKVANTQPSVSNKNEQNPRSRAIQGTEEAIATSMNPDTDQKDTVSLYSFANSKEFDSDNKFVSNYVEIKMKVSDEQKDISNLDLLMNEIGATELHTPYNSLVGNNAGNTVASTGKANQDAQSKTTVLKYKDYYLTLNQNKKLDSSAEKFNLEFSSKTDIIKKDVSSIYNEIKNQKTEIDNIITNAAQNNQDTSNYDVDKAILTKEMDTIANEKEIVIVRVLLVYS